MRWEKKLGLLGMVTFVLACGFQAQAETLSGTVMDPQQLVLVDAKVALVCQNQFETRTTDGEGNFTFTRASFPESCKIRVVCPGFAILEVRIGEKRTLTLLLQIAEQIESVRATADTISPAPLESVSLSENQLRDISDNSDDLIAYAKQVAGVFSGDDSLYVDGLPADRPPPAAAIAAITINPDPFSAENSDGGNNHIDISTKTVEPKFALTALGASLGTRVPDGVNPHLGSVSNSAALGIAGPLPFLPFSFATNVHYTDRHGDQAVEAVVPVVPGTPISPVDSSPVADSHASYGLGIDQAKMETLRLNASLYVEAAKRMNLNAGGISLPESGMRQNSSGKELRVVFTKTGQHFVSRGGISASWFHSDLMANTSAPGVSVLGAFNAGGADMNQENSEWSRWTLKDVMQVNWKGRLWNFGATVSRRGDEQNALPNPFGHIYFETTGDYVLSATAGTANGTSIITVGQGKAVYASYTAAPFVETELLRRTLLTVRAGIRVDLQTAGNALLAPRLSATSTLGRFILKAGSGMFAKTWTNDIFLTVMEDDGTHLNQYLIANASIPVAQAGPATLEPEIVARLTPNLTPERNWLSKISLERPLKNFVPGIEYSWISGTHLLGSQRLSSPTGWTDWLESNRAQQNHRIHLRALYKIAGQSFTANYEWIHSRDNTDGPFSYPARQDSVHAEWAPSSSVAAHNLSFVANSKFGKALALTLVDSWHSSQPLNITSGLDAEGDGLYTDRGGLPRNSGRGPNYNSMELFVHRRFAVPESLLRERQHTYLDCNVQILNLLANKEYSSLGTITGSPTFGQPLASAPGRSLRVSLGFSH